MFHIHFAVFQIFKPLIFLLFFISVHYCLNFFIILFTKFSKFKLILFTLSHSNLFQYVTKNNPKYKKKERHETFLKKVVAKLRLLELNNYKKRLLKTLSASSLKCYQIVINQGT